jgi:type VI secretion system protein ImpG
MMHFRPVQGFAETIRLPKGALAASIPVGGARARFATSEDLTIVPAAVTKVQVQEVGDGESEVSLTISSAAPLSAWLSPSLTIHMAGDYPEASERRGLMLRRLSRLTVETRSRTLNLDPASVERVGFSPSMRYFARQTLAPFELTQDYFVMPQKFLFLRITGLGPLAKTQEGTFTLRFRLSGLKAPLPAMRPEHFLLNACPAVNVFPHPAHPLIVDHRHDEYLLRPSDFDTEMLAIYSVAKVASVLPGGAAQSYEPFESFLSERPDARIFSLSRRSSPVTGQPEHYLSVIYPKEAKLPERETLSVELMCHNVGVTEHLRTGEINQPTDTSPSMATFANIIPPTRHCPPVEGDPGLWNLLSQLHVNLMPYLSSSSLKEILTLHSLPSDPDPGRGLSNRRRVQAVTKVTNELETSFIRGLPVRGSHIEVTADLGGFASKGDLHLFGDVLDHFFGMYHHINTYSRLTIVESSTREVVKWPPRLGLKRLL